MLIMLLLLLMLLMMYYFVSQELFTVNGLVASNEIRHFDLDLSGFFHYVWLCGARV
jgi:hypothetical protein